MSLDARLQEIDDALLHEEEVTLAVDALLADATTPGQRFVIHARLASLFDTWDESPERALLHARMATSDPAGPSIANHPALLASALTLQASKEEDVAALGGLIAIAERWAETWPAELKPCVVEIRFSLAGRLDPGAEAEANARALVTLTEREEGPRRLAEAQLELARLLAKAGARAEAGLWARRIVAPGQSPSASGVNALSLLAELETPSRDAEEFSRRGVEMAREIDLIPGEGCAEAWNILADGTDPPKSSSHTGDAVRAASYGTVDDPVLLGSDGSPTARRPRFAEDLRAVPRPHLRMRPILGAALLPARLRGLRRGGADSPAAYLAHGAPLLALGGGAPALGEDARRALARSAEGRRPTRASGRLRLGL